MKRKISVFLFSLFALSLNTQAQYKRIITLAGSGGTGGFNGDGYAATGALLNGPEDVTVDKNGTVYFVDHYNVRVRKVRTNGQIVTFAGNGTAAYAGDGTASTSAAIKPHGVTADLRGNVFISDPNYGVIRRVNTLGIISTYAGTGTFGYSGDGGAATAAKFRTPLGMCTDWRSNLYIADGANNVVRMIDTFGTVTTIAGDGSAGYSGDGFPATAAQLDSPYAVAVDRFGNIYIADHNNNVVRMVNRATGDISTLAGTGAFGYTGDGNLAAYATLNYPKGVAVDTAGNVYISDSYNNVIRMVDAATGFIKTVAGNGTPGFGGDLGDPLGANFFHPYGIAVDTFGSLFVADANNQRVRKIYLTTLAVNDVNEVAEISVFPNPATEKVTLSGLVIGDKITLTDVAGRQVVEVSPVQNSGNFELSLSNLVNGVYFIGITNNSGARKATIQILK